MNRRRFIQATLGTAACAASAAGQEMSSPAKDLNLKITGLKTFVVNAGSLNWVFCKVYTNGDWWGWARVPSPARKLPSPRPSWSTSAT